MKRHGGTAYFAEREEWPETGLADRAEPRRIGDYLWLWPRRDRSEEASRDLRQGAN